MIGIFFNDKLDQTYTKYLSDKAIRVHISKLKDLLVSIAWIVQFYNWATYFKVQYNI